MGVQFQDYYEVLGIKREATEKDIKAAYRKRARKWHPDLHTGKKKDEAEEKIKKINEAYEVLSDPEKRKKYDRLGANWENGQNFDPPPGWRDRGYTEGNFQGFEDGGGGFSDFFEMFFGGGAGGARGRRNPGGFNGFTSRPARGQDIESELHLTVEDAYRGVTQNVRLSGGKVCNECGGTAVKGNSFCTRCGGTGTLPDIKTLEVRVPPGVKDGSRIRLKGQGGEGSHGGSRGDLYLVIRLQPHPVFILSGHDVETELVIAPEQAVLGDRITVQTLDGPVTMTVPPGSRYGRKMRLKGKGFPRKGGERGDQYVRIIINISDEMDDREVEAYRNLARIKKGEPVS